MPSGFPLAFHLEGLFIQVSSIASSAAQITTKVTTDAAGDEAILTSTQDTIDVGVTTATDGSVSYKIDMDYLFDASTIYVFCKTNTGSVSVDKVELTYHE